MTDDGFREFVEIRYADLVRTAYLLTGSRHAAEDLVQIALMRAMRRWSQVDEPMAYVRRIMVNERTRLWRRFGSRELLAGVTGSWRSPSEPGRDLAHDVVVRDEMLAALHHLPPRMRAVLVLRYWEDLTEAQIADVLGCSVGTVKSQSSRALARLRAVLPAAPPRPVTSEQPAPCRDVGKGSLAAVPDASRRRDPSDGR
ncbi:SigE family RNA polymerase sigma factor [Verrucosispora sp. WMMA2121]|uniref:SigE family RNA polymerase sigma factor n=1 Tax=Verrucosispora sp. WMMA2121 TaxID=3015164 RepID=UPI0022B6B627|nr:SigE family RNA polymerase sigma factor [Verrucosispora sp. WMMA2121]MCZ7419979.1 SigE family RNA polymerase sigma factor [Verrucosispora sp. WMMA2121]